MQKRTDRIEIRIEPYIKELLADLAFEKEYTMSEYVRKLIIKELRKNAKNPSTRSGK